MIASGADTVYAALQPIVSEGGPLRVIEEVNLHRLHPFRFDGMHFRLSDLRAYAQTRAIECLLVVPCPSESGTTELQRSGISRSLSSRRKSPLVLERLSIKQPPLHTNWCTHTA